MKKKRVKTGTLDLRHKEASINVNDNTAGNFLAQPHEFIVVVKSSGRFDYLLKREKLIDQVITKTTTPLI